MTMRQVYSTDSDYHAHLVKSALEDAGIEAVIKSTHSRSEYTGIADGWPEVWIMDERQGPQAREIVDKLSASSQSSLDPNQISSVTLLDDKGTRWVLTPEPFYRSVHTSTPRARTRSDPIGSGAARRNAPGPAAVQ